MIPKTTIFAPLLETASAGTTQTLQNRLKLSKIKKHSK